MSSSEAIHRDEARSELRGRARAAVRSLDASARSVLAAQACARLQSQREWEQARSVLFYAPIQEELDVRPLLSSALQMGKVIGFPCFDAGLRAYVVRRVLEPARDMKPGRYGILEPAAHCPAWELNRLDLLLIPGVAFDLRGGRLGRGRGYYDRLLATACGVICGVAFDEQIVTEIPLAPHDVLVNRILTPSRWLRGADAGPALE